MAITIKRWESKDGSKIRFYVSGLVYQNFEDKVWIESQPVDSFGWNCNLVVRPSYMGHSAQLLKNEAETKLDALLKTSFESLTNQTIEA